MIVSSILQAAALVNVHEGVLRKAVKSGHIPARQVDAGSRNAGLEINMRDVYKWMQTRRTCKAFGDDEIAALIELAPTCTWQQVGSYLGRSPGACKEKARQLRATGLDVQKLTGATTSLPFSIPPRLQLLAKTCPKCGVLRDGQQFKRGKRQYGTDCRICETVKFKATDRYRDFHEQQKALNDITRESATNHRNQYTQSDDDQIKDSGLHPFELAMRLGRTYKGVMQRRTVLGVRIRSHNRVADDAGRWNIEFPEAMNALANHFAALGKPVPEDIWDWNDKIATQQPGSTV